MPFADTGRTHLPESSVRKLRAVAQDVCGDASAAVGTAASGQTSPVRPIVEMQRGGIPAQPGNAMNRPGQSFSVPRDTVRPRTFAFGPGRRSVACSECAQGRPPVPASGTMWASPTSPRFNMMQMVPWPIAMPETVIKRKPSCRGRFLARFSGGVPIRDVSGIKRRSRGHWSVSGIERHLRTAWPEETAESAAQTHRRPACGAVQT